MEKYQQTMWDIINGADYKSIAFTTKNHSKDLFTMMMEGFNQIPYVVTRPLSKRNWYAVTLSPKAYEWIKEQEGGWTIDRSQEPSWGSVYVLVRPELLTFMKLKFA